MKNKELKTDWNQCLARRGLARRPSGLAALALGAVLLAPLAAAAPPAVQERIPVQRVPDTWNTAPTEDSVYFDLGSADIDYRAAATIQRHAARLLETTVLSVTLVAHTDDLGSASIELAKGQERLLAVKKRLEDLKVPAARIRTENHGNESRSGSPCVDEECRRKDRRVDFVFRP